LLPRPIPAGLFATALLVRVPPLLLILEHLLAVPVVVAARGFPVGFRVLVAALLLLRPQLLPVPRPPRGGLLVTPGTVPFRVLRLRASPPPPVLLPRLLRVRPPPPPGTLAGARPPLLVPPCRLGPSLSGTPFPRVDLRTVLGVVGV